jgi:hypothetical protein
MLGNDILIQSFLFYIEKFLYFSKAKPVARIETGIRANRRELPFAIILLRLIF